MILKQWLDFFYFININFKLIYFMSCLVSECMGMFVQLNKVIVGANVFVYFLGIYQDGVIKCWDIYEIIDLFEVGVDYFKIVFIVCFGWVVIVYWAKNIGYNFIKDEFDVVYVCFLEVVDSMKEVDDIVLE